MEHLIDEPAEFQIDDLYSVPGDITFNGYLFSLYTKILIKIKIVSRSWNCSKWYLLQRNNST